MMPKRVLVTGVGGASGMYTAKILKETGYYVVGTDANGFAAGSVICDEFCVVSKASF
jgi:GDP-D-mannose dehydratase